MRFAEIEELVATFERRLVVVEENKGLTPIFKPVDEALQARKDLGPPLFKPAHVDVKLDEAHITQLRESLLEELSEKAAQMMAEHDKERQEKFEKTLADGVSQIVERLITSKYQEPAAHE